MARKHRIKYRKVETSRNVAAKSEPFHKTVSILRDGNCLFRALSYGVYNTQEQHKNIRQEIVREVIKNWETYRDFIIGDTAYGFRIDSDSDYQACMGSLGKFGGHQELQAFVAIHTQVYVEIHSSHGLMACFGNLQTCKSKFSLLFTGNLDRGHYDFLKPWEIVESDQQEEYDDYAYTYEVENQKGSRKRRW